MNKLLVVGYRTLGLPFQEQLTISDTGLSHYGKIVNWNDVKRIKITHFEEGMGRIKPWWNPYSLEYIKWKKITIETVSWKVVLDSRVTIQPNDDMKYALGNFKTETDKNLVYECITPTFTEIIKFLEKFCSNKIINKKAFAGSFDFSEWTSWIGAVFVLLLISFILAVICYALRPLFM